MLPQLKGQTVEELKVELEQWALAIQAWMQEAAALVNLKVDE